MTAPLKKALKAALAATLPLYCSIAAAATGQESLSYTLPLPPTKSAATAWGKDPFAPAVSAPGAARAASPDMRLSAVFYNPQKPSAIINGSVVYVGSVVNGQKVIDIGNTHVILFGASGRIRLEITEAPEHTDGAKQKK